VGPCLGKDGGRSLLYCREELSSGSKVKKKKQTQQKKAPQHNPKNPTNPPKPKQMNKKTSPRGDMNVAVFLGVEESVQPWKPLKAVRLQSHCSFSESSSSGLNINNLLLHIRQQYQRVKLPDFVAVCNQWMSEYHLCFVRRQKDALQAIKLHVFPDF